MKRWSPILVGYQQRWWSRNSRTPLKYGCIPLHHLMEIDSSNRSYQIWWFMSSGSMLIYWLTRSTPMWLHNQWRIQRIIHIKSLHPSSKSACNSCITLCENGEHHSELEQTVPSTMKASEYRTTTFKKDRMDWTMAIQPSILTSQNFISL